MSTFLGLAQETRALSGIGGTGPASVTTATGIEARIVNYVKNAYIDIQAHPKKWKWMWGRYLAPTPGGAPLQTILNTREYPLTGVKHVRVRSFRSYLTATGVSDRQRMVWMDWEDFDRAHGAVDEQAGRPIRITRDPSGQIVLYPKADAVYSIEFEYFSRAQVLAANDDVLTMPEDYCQLIVYEALKRFGKAEDAPEIIKLGEEAAGSEGNEGRPVSGLWRALIWDQEYKDAATDGESARMVVRTREDYEDY
ncbi:MAG: hypothetical protein GY815_04230 [Gammaproteobacteria bacterium]|nr:hypothetical protein [Gammaproteobacteria bacterium]